MSKSNPPKMHVPPKSESVGGTDRHPVHEAGGAAGGALAGAAIGSLGGPAGAAAGAVIGGVVGVFVAKIGDEEAARVSLHDGELDAAIGVSGGDLGAPNLKHPPAVRVEARISRSGNAMPQAGDLVGVGPVVAPGARDIAIVIDKVLP